MNILVTGGAGFIGSHTAVALTQAGFTPVIIDDFSTSQPSVLEGLRQIIGQEPRCYAENCHHADTLRRIFKEENIAGVIHFAAFKAVGESMEHHDGDVAGALVVFQRFAYFEAVFFGHHHIRHDEVGDGLERSLDARLTIAGEYDLVVLAHTSRHIIGHIGMVFHDEHPGAVIGSVGQVLVVRRIGRLGRGERRQVRQQPRRAGLPSQGGGFR